MTSKTDQVDIATDVQKGIKEANEHDNDKPQENADKQRATRYDGHPDPDGDSEPGLFKPRDDTPMFLEKKSGPKNP